jgi:hypothetical protein
MKRVLLALVVAGLMVGPAASAQVAVVPRGGTAEIGTAETGRTERTERTGRTERTERTERTGRTERTERTGRTPGTPRTPGEPRPGVAPAERPDRRLPATGSPVAAAAFDGMALLTVGFALTRLRRRFA